MPNHEDYRRIHVSHKPIATWFPNETTIQQTHLYQWIHEGQFADYAALHTWSYQEHAQFLEKLIKRLPISFDHPYSTTMDVTNGVESPIWFRNGKLNIVNSCFQAEASSIAIIEKNEEGRVRAVTYKELDDFSNQIASAIAACYQPGDRFAIIMPMNIEAVAIHLGIIKAGCATIAIAESFSKIEIEARLRIANARAIFIQDRMIRNKKDVSLYNMLIDETSLPAILVETKEKSCSIRQNDRTFVAFIALGSAIFKAVSCLPSDYTTILFSSGTTGDPKAIPWTHTTPIKCASDAYFHHDLKPGDRFLWPTSLGWMMGAWLIYASLINKATIALFDGSPNHPLLGAFIEKQQLTHIGVVPTLVKSWRTTKCMEEHDWSHIKLFTSTAECSNADDMQYLMSLADKKPIIEYCGGTEIAGAYVTSTLLTPLAPAAFTTAAMGMHFLILDEEGNQASSGEVVLVPPAIGLSTTLLNADHHAVYYANVIGGEKFQLMLRKHGDLIEQFDNGFYQLLGRADDTMNISGIKISCVEIERLLLNLPGIQEVAVIGITPFGGGPSLLVIFVVQKDSCQLEKNALKDLMQDKIKNEMNRLFKIFDLEILTFLPRTASNKVLRRVLKKEYEKKLYEN